MKLIKNLFSLLFLMCGSFSLSSQSVSIDGLSESCQQMLVPILSDLEIEPAMLNLDSEEAIAAAARLKKALHESGRWEEISTICSQGIDKTSCKDCKKCHCSVKDCCYWGGCLVCDQQCCGFLYK